MGLDTTHDCYSGGYGGFNLLRAAIARAAGEQIEDSFSVLYNYDDFRPINFHGEWDKTPEDILTVLIVHSDCEGKIMSEHCGPLADRIEKLLPDIPEVDHAHGGRRFRKMAQRFVDGLREAAEANEDVEFF